MKQKFTNWLQGMLLLLSLIVLITVILVLNSLHGREPNLIAMHHENIRNTLYIASFIYFVLAVTAYFYLPIYFRRSLNSVRAILRDIRQGVYDNEIDLEEMRNFLDPVVYDLLLQISEMKETVQKFDQLKKSKIYEQYSRLRSLLRIIQDGALILDDQGQIIFCNDKLLDAFPQLTEGDNLLEKTYPPEIENNLKKLVQSSLQEKKRLEAIQCFIPNLKRHITIDSVPVRNEGGEITGLAVTVMNLEKKKAEKKQDKGNEST